MVLGGLMGGLCILGGFQRGFQPDLFFFPMGLAVLWLVIRTLRQPYRLHLTESGALEFTTGIGKVTFMPNSIRSIRTGLQSLCWDGADARVIHITHDRGEICVPNFDGAAALFTEILRKYPNIQAGKLDFQQDF